MLSNIPALGIRFNIDKIASASYGFHCWKIFWRAVGLEKMRGVLLFEGDSAATLNGSENTYCIGIQSFNEDLLKEVQKALEKSSEFQRIASPPIFIEGDPAIAEPLVNAGKIDAAGNFLGDAYNPREAFVAVAKEEKPK
jgi:hypothetical protein